MKATKDQIDKAVAWWVTTIQEPKFDAGADSPQMQAAQLLAERLAVRIEKSDLETFKTQLTTMLGDLSMPADLRCDYNPCTLLVDATKGTDIPTSNFPWKTNMQIRDDGTVSVSYGYRAPIITL